MFWWIFSIFRAICSRGVRRVCRVCSNVESAVRNFERMGSYMRRSWALVSDSVPSRVISSRAALYL